MSPSSISHSNRQVLARVCGRALLFLAPLLLLVGFMEAIFWRGRECWPASWIRQEFKADPDTLYGPRYFQPAIDEVRLEILREGSVEVLALGSSRVTRFRATMFAPMETRFLNAGLMVTNVSELESFASLFLDGRLPLPKVIIVGIDPWWMKNLDEKSSPKLSPSELLAHPNATVSAAAHLEAMRTFLGNVNVPWGIFSPSHQPKDPFYGHNAIGLGAMLNGNCYRTDGSILSCEQIADYLATGHYVDRETPPIIERIRNRTMRFNPSSGVNWKKANRIIAALAALKAKGIEVYAFLPPFSTESDKALREIDELSTWYREYRVDFLQRLREAGIVTVDVPTPAIYGLSDDTMTDGFHASDFLMAYVVEDLVKQAPRDGVLGSVDLDHLRKIRTGPGVVPVALDVPPAMRTK